MPIKLTISPKGKTFRAVPEDTDSYNKDRDILIKIPNKKPIFKDDEFQCWEFPGDQLEDVLSSFNIMDIRVNEDGIPVIDQWIKSNACIDDLPSYKGKLFDSLDGKILREHQEYYARVDHEKKALLCSFFMGGGKTLTSTVRAKSIGFNRLVIICPKRLISNWKAAIQDICGIDPFVYRGSPAKRKKLQAELKDAHIIITNYEMARELTGQNLAIDHFIIDEVHILSNPKANISKAVHTLLNIENPDAPRQGLSGTPIRLTVENLYHILYLLDPKFAGRKAQFIKRYQKVVKNVEIKRTDKYGNTYSFYKPIKVESKNEGLLKKKLDSIMVRVTSNGILGFEDAVEIVTVDMTRKQASLYKDIKQEVIEDLKINNGNPLTKTLRLLQMAEGAYTLFPEVEESGKIDYLLEELQERSGEKAVIWFRFLPGTDILHKKLPGSVLYTGNVSDNMKDLAVWAFNGVKNKAQEDQFFKLKERYNFPFNPGEAQYIVGTYSQKSGMGVDLDASGLSYFLSYDYSPVALLQAKDRIIRLTQTRDCETKFLQSAGTTEPKVLKTLLSYLESHYNILDGKFSENSKLTRELMECIL